MSETFFRGRDTGSIFARLPNGNFMILYGREAFANQEGGILKRSDVMAGNGVELIETPAASLWVCFHCGDTFTDDIEAREHFGPTMDSEPICQVTAERYRDVERQLEAYRNESDATARTFYDIGHRAAVEARDAEQKGYDRGLQDAKAHPETIGLQPAITQGDIDMAKHFAREEFHNRNGANDGLEAALSKMVECLKP